MAVDFPEIKTFSAASFEPFTKGLEAIAAETTDYSKKSLEKSQAFFEKLFGVKKIDEAIQLQSDFAKSAYDDFLAYTTKLGETYSSLAKEAFKPANVAPPVVASPSKTVAVKQS